MGRKRKKFRRHRGMRLFYKILSVILALAAILTGTVLFFQVEHIEVSGNEKYSAEQILTAANVSEKANLILLPQGRIQNDLLTSLPYLSSVKICRRFPTTLQIHLTESKPISAIACDDTWCLLSEEGKILEQVDESLAQTYIEIIGLPLLTPTVGQLIQVAPEDIARRDSLTNLLAALADKDLLSKVSLIDFSTPNEIKMNYDNRLTVDFLVGADFPRKLRILLKASALIDENAIGTFDLRADCAYFRAN
ncbi:MAG: FtsQ-type POTRA domain-containing protein [Evtepia sp.]